MESMGWLSKGGALAVLAMATWPGLATGASPPPSSSPTVFGANEITSDIDDGAAAVSPDGNTVVFMHGTDSLTLMQSHRTHGHWSKLVVAPFAGQWSDFDPAFSPDGRFLLFVSNRPVAAGGKALDAVHNGKVRVGGGMAIWRVDRQGEGWGTPVRLPDVVNRCSMTFAPSVAADGSVYYMGCAGGGDFKPMRAAIKDGHYAPPEIITLGNATDTIRDPAIAPDQSFVVYSIKARKDDPYRLAISWQRGSGWSAPCDLGDAVNGGKHSMGAQLGADQRTLFFYSDRKLPASDPNAGARWDNGDDHIFQVSLSHWLDDRAHACHAS